MQTNEDSVLRCCFVYLSCSQLDTLSYSWKLLGARNIYRIKFVLNPNNYLREYFAIDEHRTLQTNKIFGMKNDCLYHADD